MQEIASDSSVRRGHQLYFPSAVESVEASACRVIVANTHILFNPKRGDIKVNHTCLLMLGCLKCWMHIGDATPIMLN